MLERYFELKISDFGFSPEDIDLRWNVGFCQGDFVSFTGPVRPDTIRKLMMKMHGLDVGPESERYPLCPDELSDMLKVLTDFGECDLHFKSFGNSGVPSVYVETIDDFEEIFDYSYQPIVAQYNDTIAWDKNREWQRQWKAFLEWLKVSHDRLCNDLLFAAHEILLAGSSSEEVVWQRQTTNYIAQVIEDRDQDVNSSVQWLPDDEVSSLYADFIEGRKRYGIFHVKILDSATHRELGSSSYYSFISDAKSRDYGLQALRLCALKEAVTDTRQLLTRHQRVA